MATSYKIRLRRFNGVDYDTLNLSSDNIIMGNGNTLQNIIPSTNGMVKNNNGNFQTAVAGTDYLTTDTAYSPLKFKNANYTLTADDLGKTVSADTASQNVTITLPSDLNTSAPVGAEIALLWHAGNNTAQVNMQSISGAWYSNGGDGVRVKVATLNKFDMVVLKKLANGVWVLFGNVEVVS